MRNTHCKKGLTLLEMLTVLAIIALLVGIIVPVVVQARKYSQRTVCASNLRQIHLAWSLYFRP